MDREKALEFLRQAQRLGSHESAHIEADAVLCELLSDLGYGDVVEEWRKIAEAGLSIGSPARAWSP